MIHNTLTPERWARFTIYEQLANVGCDVDRAIRWRNKGEPEYSRQAFERALELLDLTIRDPKNKGPKLKELLRVREVWVDYFLYDNQYHFTDEFWHNYFYYFSYIAAYERGL